ncbi:MAG: class I SAM-dependent methyltransferase [Candidatus Heimdallarchaeota archaeon]
MDTGRHFNAIAQTYRSLRRIDYSPLRHIFKLLSPSSPLQGLELGCGTGRYTEILLKHFPNLYLRCVDISKAMLRELERNLRSQGFSRFKSLQKRVEDVSFSKNTFDALFSFNAIHHFDLEQILPLLEESVKQGGWIFFYTRLQSQNKSTIWGKHFPKFAKKENRLYTEDQLQDYFHQSPQLRIYSIMKFQYPRKATVKELLKSADNAHYSTFCFYTPSEYKLARVQFKRNLLQTYGNPGTIKWTDRYTLLIARRIA